MDWFEKLMGFKEINYKYVQNNIKCDYTKNYLTSEVNTQTYYYGKLDIISLSQIKEQINKINIQKNKINVTEVIGNVTDLHKNKKNENSLFQVASQFNLLEMACTSLIPENGVSIYENDYTQGPACAISCGAGTIYRNYFIKIDNQIGQSKQKQINCLKDVLDYFGIEANNKNYINGYFLPNKKELKHINNKIKSLDNLEKEIVKGLLKVGIQWDTEVTISKHRHKVSQIYCSALPISYSELPENLWVNFAKLILEAAYEATFGAAVLNYDRKNNGNLFLTKLGGGVFGNDLGWIETAIDKSIEKYETYPINVIRVKRKS